MLIALVLLDQGILQDIIPISSIGGAVDTVPEDVDPILDLDPEELL